MLVDIDNENSGNKDNLTSAPPPPIPYLIASPSQPPALPLPHLPPLPMHRAPTHSSSPLRMRNPMTASFAVLVTAKAAK